MTSSYKNVRIRHASGAPINASTPLQTEIEYYDKNSGWKRVNNDNPLPVDANIDMAASENHIGEVGGSSIEIAPTVTVDTSAYAAGDCIGGKLTLTDAMRVNGGTGILQSLFLLDRSGTQKPALEILVFNSDPSSSTLTDQAAVSIHANDVSKIIRRIPIAAGDWGLVAGIYMADLSPGSRMLQAAAGSKNLYATIVATGAHDFVASTDLSIRFGLMRD